MVSLQGPVSGRLGAGVSRRVGVRQLCREEAMRLGCQSDHQVNVFLSVCTCLSLSASLVFLHVEGERGGFIGMHSKGEGEKGWGGGGE